MSREVSALSARNLFKLLVSGRMVYKGIYFANLCSYLILDEPLDIDFLKTLNRRRYLVTESKLSAADIRTMYVEHDKRALERVELCKSYLKEHPVDVDTSLRRLWQEYSLTPQKYLCKHNFGEYSQIWNPWYGCHKISEGCANCYIRPVDDPASSYYPARLKKVPAGNFVSVCLQSDFFLEDADELRPKAWTVIKDNPNLIFLLITKRVGRIKDCLPDDWGEGYNNVVLCATAENQRRADERLPWFLEIPAKHRWITCSPLLGPIDLSEYLKTGLIEHVETTGERDATMDARPTKYEWSLDLSKQCREVGVRFTQLYLGSSFLMPDGRILQEWAEWYRCKLAESLNLSYYRPITFQLADTSITY